MRRPWVPLPHRKPRRPAPRLQQVEGTNLSSATLLPPSLKGTFRKLPPKRRSRGTEPLWCEAGPKRLGQTLASATNPTRHHSGVNYPAVGGRGESLIVATRDSAECSGAGGYSRTWRYAWSEPGAGRVLWWARGQFRGMSANTPQPSHARWNWTCRIGAVRNSSRRSSAIGSSGLVSRKRRMLSH